MTLVVNDPALRQRLLLKRKASGGDRYDEVWEGDHVISPLAGDEHRDIVTALAGILYFCIGVPGLGEVRAGVNVSDREAGWEHNYRVPDVAVRMAGGSARVLETHWCGGPDFLVEVLSEGDRAREKLGFYAAIGTREVLVVDRDPWALELYGLQHGRLVPVGVSRAPGPQRVTSAVVPLTFELLEPMAPRARLAVADVGSGHRWVF